MQNVTIDSKDTLFVSVESFFKFLNQNPAIEDFYEFFLYKNNKTNRYDVFTLTDAYEDEGGVTYGIRFITGRKKSIDIENDVVGFLSLGAVLKFEHTKESEGSVVFT